MNPRNCQAHCRCEPAPLPPEGSDVIAFTVYGEAKPGGSKRAFRNPHTGKIAMVDASGKPGKDWRRAVAEAGAEAMRGRPLLQGPLVVSMDFYRPRPKSHYRTGQNQHLLSAKAPRRPETRPDLLKLARLAEDSLTGIIWRDDAQIVSEFLRKFYDEPARLELTIGHSVDDP